MKIILNKEDEEKLYKLLETNEINYGISEVLNYYFYNLPTYIDRSIIEEQIKDSGSDISSAFIDTFLDLFSIDDLKIREYFSNNISLLDTKKYKNNEYLKNVSLKEVKENSIKVYNETIYEFEGFSYSDLIVDENKYYLENMRIGFFNEDYHYPVISKNNNIWMSIIPNEIETMEKPINDAFGKVLVYGLGLGYYIYMISLKESVKKITVIENDEEVINIFNKYIFNQFKHKDKITIIKEDAIKYEEKRDTFFDFVFIDIYRSEIDGFPIYCKFKKLEKDSCVYSYWLEESIINVVRRNLITIIREYKENLNVDYTKSKNENDEIINNLYKLIKDRTFTTYKEIFDLLSRENLISIIKKL